MGTTAGSGIATGNMHTGSQSTSSTLPESLLSVWHNTWITSTTIEPTGSLTLEPFPTFGNAAQAALSSSAPSGGTAAASANDSIDSSFSDNADAVPSALPGITGGRGVNVNSTAGEYDPGPEDTGKAFAVAGITAASIIVAVLVLLAIAMYIRSGLSWKPSVNCLIKRKASVSAPASASESSVKQAVEGFFQWGNRAVWRGDLEAASASSGAGARCGGRRGEDGEGMWEEIDIRDPRSGCMEKDNGEWLEAWRRQKESMMADLCMLGGGLEGEGRPCPR
ncbi:hypothetical protein EW145_g7473 [Phellinidium pouzarii]|uniref:Uncharacterized protein n=1 Tax=Phellinidium pouzarii TaxID=167371 RepID=A0A4S4KJP6_9AGAM|nr:hypothetical protein EW145_g7473 [Phellinidium pouzarii]